MKKILFLILIIISIIPSISLSADDKYTLLEPLPCIEGIGNCDPSVLQTEISITDYIGYIYKFSIALAVLLAIIVIIYGGFEWMLSEAVPTKLDAKGRIWGAITGLIMVLCSYLILRTIDPRFVQVYTTIPPIISSNKSATMYGQSIQFLTGQLDALNADEKKLEAWQKTQGIDPLKQETKDKISELDKKIEQANNKINEIPGPEFGPLTKEQATEQAIELEKLKVEVKSDEAKKLILMRTDTANSIFFNTISKPDSDINSYKESRYMIVDMTLNSTINNLKERGDFLGAQKIENLKGIYIKEFDEESELNAILKSNDTVFLKKKLALYNQKLNSINTGKDILTAAYGMDIEKYKTHLNFRIERINKALNIKTGK